MRPSRDKVGRRFPVLIFASSETASDIVNPPVVDSDQTFFETLTTQLDDLDGLDASQISDRLQDASGAANAGIGSPAEPAIAQSSFWAVSSEPGPDGLDQLMVDAAAADHAQAAVTRSYWWNVGDERTPSAVHAADGLPGADVFAWFVAGMAAAGFANDEEGA